MRCSGPLDSRFNSSKIKCRFHVGPKCQSASPRGFSRHFRHLSDPCKNKQDGPSRTIPLQVPSRIRPGGRLVCDCLCSPTVASVESSDIVTLVVVSVHGPSCNRILLYKLASRRIDRHRHSAPKTCNTQFDSDVQSTSIEPSFFEYETKPAAKVKH